MTSNSSPKDEGSLKARVRSALIFMPLFLVAVFLGGPVFALLMMVIAGLAGFEWSRMTTDRPPAGLHQAAGALTALGAGIGGASGHPVASLLVLAGGAFFVFAYLRSQNGEGWRDLAVGMLYIGFAVAIMIWLRGFTGQGLHNMLTLILIVWASDTGAYFAGRAIGGPKLAPKISPKKTWAGFFGGSVASALVGVVMALPFTLNVLEASTYGLGLMGYAVLGFVLSMVGQVGDLMISAVKRKRGIKDTGALLPGHGGILDRIDALLLVTLVFGALIWALMQI